MKLAPTEEQLDELDDVVSEQDARRVWVYVARQVLEATAELIEERAGVYWARVRNHRKATFAAQAIDELASDVRGMKP